MNVRQATQVVRQSFPGADAISIDLSRAGVVRVTVLVGGWHHAMLRASERLGRAFLDARRRHAVLDLLSLDSGMSYEVGYVA